MNTANLIHIAIIIFILSCIVIFRWSQKIKIKRSESTDKEYLIRRTDGEWFDLHKDSFVSTLKPNSIESIPVNGWGSHRIKTTNGEISFSEEDPGIQVVFEKYKGTQEEIDTIIKEILTNIEQVTNQKGRIINL